MYKRKTVDEWEVLTDYGYGFDVEYTAETYREAKRVYHDILKNANVRDAKIVKRRVKKEEVQ